MHNNQYAQGLAQPVDQPRGRFDLPAAATVQVPILLAQFVGHDDARVVANDLRYLGADPRQIDVFMLDVPFDTGRSGSDGENAGTNHPIPRPSGVRVAVGVPTPLLRAQAETLFDRRGALSIEHYVGRWLDGELLDFDPVISPRWILPPAA